MNKEERIGVFGGSFDPIHNAHIGIARTALSEAGLDKVLFVVSARPPHKRGETWASAEERYAMVAAALTDEPGMEPSRVELERGGPSYTVETLRSLSERHPGAELSLIMGYDSLVDLPGWRSPEQILSQVRLLVVPRPSDREPPPELEGQYEILPFDETPLSSTEVRERLAAGEPYESLVPPVVARIIEEKGLYRGTPENGAG